mgnify:CR=1 FL=1
MPIDKNIKKRLAEAVAKSYFVPWHKRWWGKGFLILAVFGVIFLAYFGYMIVDNITYISKGFVYDSTTGLWVSPEQYGESQRIAAELMRDNDPWIGSEQPALFIVAYESFTCPYCKESQADIKQFMSKYGSIVLFVAKDYPLEGTHANALGAHLAAACAEEQDSYWEYRDILYAHQDEFSVSNFKGWAVDIGLKEDQFNVCLDNKKYIYEIRQDIAEGKQLGVSGTPSYVVNGALIPGLIPYSTWEQILAVAIK